jgi:hypothetical protein
MTKSRKAIPSKKPEVIAAPKLEPRLKRVLLISPQPDAAVAVTPQQPSVKVVKKQSHIRVKTHTVPNPSKQAMMIDLLQRSQGATMQNLLDVTGWQSHSVRGVISGVLKKRLGLAVLSEQQEHERVYRIAGEHR